VDYILIAQKDLPLTPEANEVRDVKYFSKEELKAFVDRTDLKFTPWFKLIHDNFLYKWWNALDNLDSVKDDKIHHLL
jgi:isopentenyl-diphosphate delta-isomerase